MSPTASASSTSRISGIHVDRHRERQPHHHAARVRLHRLIDEVADLRERLDVAVALVDLPRGEAENRAVQVDVVAPAEFRIEARAQFQQRRDAAVDRHRCREVGCRMPATICSSVLLPDPFSPTMQNVSPRFTSKLTSCSAQKSLWRLQAVEGQQFLQPVARRVVDRVALGDALELDGVHNQQSSVALPPRASLAYRQGTAAALAATSFQCRVCEGSTEIEGAAAGPLGSYRKRARRTAVLRPRRHITKTRRVRTRDQPAEEAGSRPSGGLVLCTSSFSVFPR